MRHKHSKTTATALVLILIVMSGCSVLFPDKKKPPEGEDRGYYEGMYNVFNDLEGAAKDMALGIVTNLKIEFHRSDTINLSPIVVTTFADLNDLSLTTTLGRSFSEMVMTGLHARNFEIIEMRKGNAIDIVKNDGEFMLTRNLRDLAKKQNAKSVFVGTYTITDKSVVFNGRLIGISDSKLYSAWTTRLVRTKEVDSLLRQKNRTVIPEAENEKSNGKSKNKKTKANTNKQNENGMDDEPVTVYERMPVK
ncbi:FlgO family outer membrane protein [Candidatus Magnetomonas plexicatena]|uniref:FlgO family outer membrane protein n=1 Tax=Candidatus Magnetomonas plexicatena TaxID=2552947 RepID=UPI0011056503|nr:hypothetical protein E2O03_006760 [Nitrospirales bacterium LBB_01]